MKQTFQVLRAEHLLAIRLQTGRSKDRDRVRLLADEAPLDHDYLQAILKKHHLVDQWQKWTA